MLRGGDTPSNQLLIVKGHKDMLLLDRIKTSMKTTKALFRILNITRPIEYRVFASWILPVLLLLGLTALVQAQSYTDSYGTWTYTTANGTITITEYTGPGGDVIIPDRIPDTTDGLPVTAIAGYSYNGGWWGAFDGCYNLTSVAIPNSVTSIPGGGAFSNCSSLTEVTMGDSVTNIGFAAFYDCSSLSIVTIPGSVSSIGDSAFGNCSSLTSLTIPSSVNSIGGSAFGGCTGLTNATIGSGVTNVTEGAFMDCSSLTAVYFEGNAPSPGLFAFTYDPAIVYYLPGTTGWGSTYGSLEVMYVLPTMLWNTQVQPSSLGLRSNQFGFNITGSSNLVVVVKASTNLANPTWYPLKTNILNGNPLYFTDPQWTNYPSRFYGLSMP